MDDVSLKKLANYSVLYVEDDYGVQKSMVEFLELIFKDVYSASNGLEAYELYEQKNLTLSSLILKCPI